MKSKLSGFLPSFAEELSKIEKGQPSLAHLIFGLGALMLAMHMGSKAGTKEKNGSKKGLDKNVEGAGRSVGTISKVSSRLGAAAGTNSSSKSRPSKTVFASGFDGQQARYVGPMI